ncbi:DUF3048 domain-containing protein [Streptomyces fulvorobeus]|uniref:CchlO n=1 Tax=Streptomyces fulvorobeus TaxID=284028 RepID=A0A7J0C176_9ACTN|nr:DUF3048 domain-containing protein [Streptomyces fulvorobeus]NYE39490.1 hypothetical protein [Streptomyces fulvorobeus]GFM95724.1 hypothetical protein Sfulv_05350 [Streptomyces fulvorobeus]
MHTSLPRRQAATRVTVLAFLLALLVAAVCGCQAGGGASPPPGSPDTPAGRADVLAVKIDNVAPARPPTGLEKADLVYVEQVEAGLSRILAVYSSAVPPVIGPVRSARETDLELLRQFDGPTLAYSGAQSALQPSIEAAPLDAVPPSKAPNAYVRERGRPAPHNLYLRPAELPHKATGVNAAEAVGLRFAPAPDGGTPADARTVSYPSARFTFTWSPGQQKWLVTMDGKPSRTAAGDRLAAGTVLVQDVTLGPSRFRDRWGNTSPFTETVGSGSAVALRDGKAYDVTWKRDSAASATEYTTRDGRPMTFARGQIWVVLVPG